jgi:hypothetical protein
MVPPWLLLLLVIPLGFIPPSTFYRGDIRYMTMAGARARLSLRVADDGRRRRRWWKHLALWLDPVRGFLVAFFLAQALAELPAKSGLQDQMLQLAHAFVLWGWLWVQMTLGRQDAADIVAPVGFLGGLLAGVFTDSLGLAGGMIGVLSIASVWATHSFVWGYVITTLAATVVSYLFLGPSPAGLIYVVCTAGPIIYAFLRRAQLVFPFRV